jgi:hypothetical protein
VVVHRIQDSLHQALIRIRVIVLSRAMLWVLMVRVLMVRVLMVRVLMVRVLMVDPATTFITHGSPWGILG